MYSENSILQITDTPDIDSNVSIYDGQLVWDRLPFSDPPASLLETEVYAYINGNGTQLTNNMCIDSEPVIHAGQIAWYRVCMDPHRESIMLYGDPDPIPTQEPTPAPTATPRPELPDTSVRIIIEIEAEDGLWEDGSITKHNDAMDYEKYHEGYSGSGFVDTINETGVWVELTANLLNDAEAYLYFTYSNSSLIDQPAQLTINGIDTDILTFPQTKSYSLWDEELVIQNLTQGENTIRLTALTPDGLPHFDKLEIVYNKIGESCGISLFSLNKESGYAGDAIEMYGVWGDTQGEKIPCIQNGDIYELTVFSWSNATLLVQIPTDIPVGDYQVGVYCDDPANNSYSTELMDFTIISNENVYEAEIYGSSYEDRLQVYNDEPGYSGTGYVQPSPNGNGAYLDMTITRDQAENVELVYYYFSHSQPHIVFFAVNGKFRMNEPITFYQQGTSGTWNTAHIVVSLEAGENIIRIVSPTYLGLAYIDKLEIRETSDIPPVPGPIPIDTPGTVWCEPVTINTGVGSFSHEVHVNTGDQNLDDLQIFLIFDKTKIHRLEFTGEIEGLGFGYAGFVTGCVHTSSVNTHTSKKVPTPRIYVENTSLMVDGKPIFINGVNTPWCLWNDFGGNYISVWWDQEFKRIKKAGGNAARIWMTCSREVGITIDSNGYVSGATQAHRDDLADMFQLAQSNRIYVLATLISFDHTKDKYRTYESFRNMYAKKSNIDSFAKNYVVPFINQFGDNPYLFAVEPCNEIEWVNQNSDNARLLWKTLQYFCARVVAEVHANSDVLTTIGLSVKWQTDTYPGNEGNQFSHRPLRSQNNNPEVYLDFYSPHFYDWVTDWFGNPMASTKVSQYGLTDKPVVIGELPAEGVGGINITNCYMNGYKNGLQGLMAWTSKNLHKDLGKALTNFSNNYPDLVFPAGEESGT